MYLSAKRDVSYKQDSKTFFDLKNLFGTVYITPEDGERDDLGIQFYISDWPHDRTGREKVEAQQLRGVLDYFSLRDFLTDGSPSGTVTFKGDTLEVAFHVAYWRKANQVHNWFVQNVQGGEDECRPHDVSREQLKTLSDLCQRVLDAVDLEDTSVAEELLPSSSGFFFGSTDYGEWYLNDLRETVAQIEKALQLPDEWSFVYRSSW